MLQAMIRTRAKTHLKKFEGQIFWIHERGEKYPPGFADIVILRFEHGEPVFYDLLEYSGEIQHRYYLEEVTHFQLAGGPSWNMSPDHQHEDDDAVMLFSGPPAQPEPIDWSKIETGWYWVKLKSDPGQWRIERLERFNGDLYFGLSSVEYVISEINPTPLQPPE
jgi:hypothetical protein